MDIYNFINQKYLEQQRTGKRSIKFPELKIKKTQLKSLKNSHTVKAYSCGHSVKEVVINTNIDTLSIYNEWKNSESDLCVECWLKNNNNYRVNYES